MQKVWRTTLLLQALLGCRTSSTFERERKILATLNHPQLPRLYDTFEDAEHYYLVIDYFAGETLEQYLHWDVRTGRRLLQRNYDASQITFIPSLVAWSPDSKQLAFPALANGKYSIQIVNSSTGQVIKTCASITSSGNDALGTISWSPNGRYIAAT